MENGTASLDAPWFFQSISSPTRPGDGKRAIQPYSSVLLKCQMINQIYRVCVSSVHSVMHLARRATKQAKKNENSICFSVLTIYL